MEVKAILKAGLMAIVDTQDLVRVSQVALGDTKMVALDREVQVVRDLWAIPAADLVVMEMAGVVDETAVLAAQAKVVLKILMAVTRVEDLKAAMETVVIQAVVVREAMEAIPVVAPEVSPVVMEVPAAATQVEDPVARKEVEVDRTEAEDAQDLRTVEATEKKGTPAVDPAAPGALDIDNKTTTTTL